MSEKKWTPPTPDEMQEIFVAWYNSHVADFDVNKIKKDETFVVWYCYTVGNAKALVSTIRPDHMYYEITYHANKDEVYVDQYLKVSHTIV